MSLIAGACDYCSCFVGITPYDNQSSFSVMYRYKSFNGYSSMKQPKKIFPDGSLRPGQPDQNSIQHGQHVVSEPKPSLTEYEIFRALDFRGKFFIHSRLELNALYSIHYNRHVIQEESENNVKGPGDIYGYAGYHLISRPDALIFPQRLIGGAGVKLPTGKCDVSKNGERIHPELQPGTGSTDVFAYVNYILGYRHWGLNLYALQKINGRNRFNEKVGDNTLAQASMLYKLKKGNWFIIPSAQAIHEYTRGISVGNQLESGTGMNLCTAGIGLDLFYKNFGINTTFQLPVYEDADDRAMSNSSRLAIGVSYSFNQTGYLFGK